MVLLEAIAHQEGFYSPKSRPARNNNPGDLMWGPETKGFGATSGDPRFAIFPSLTLGWIGLQRWLSVPAKFDKSGNLVGGYLGATLKQAIFRFAPPNENHSDIYLGYVIAQTGLTEDTPLTKEILNIPQA